LNITKEIGSTDFISSISLGCERKFVFREIKDKNKIYEFTLEDGSLFIMGKNTQERYQHSIPEDKNSKTGRINLTFRQYEKYMKK